MMTETTKIVINGCYGGFGVSEEGMRRYAELKGLPFYVWQDPKYSSDLFKMYFTADPSGMTEIDNEFYRKYNLYDRDLDRTDPALVQVVEELGEKANGWAAKLVVEELAKGTLYRIEEYDGYESIETADDVNWKVA
jgi:hypothetical protein